MKVFVVISDGVCILVTTSELEALLAYGKACERDGWESEEDGWSDREDGLLRETTLWLPYQEETFVTLWHKEMEVD